ncbi:hypothetical protein [Streptomyces sp. NPDC048603]|uniref:hypothetical protein n=1 Tax=Streptomyces sp. NPDC048603 TaxID=3365577 RepID=UPI003711B83C
MRIRSALTASFMAAGILLAGAGAAAADGHVDIDRFYGGHAAYTSNCSTTVAVPPLTGPAYATTCVTSGEKDWAKAGHLGA